MEVVGRFFFPFVSPINYVGNQKFNYLSETIKGKSLVGTNFLKANKYLSTDVGNETFSPGIAVEDKKSKIIVMGNSSFLQNRFEQFSDLSNILFSHLEWVGDYQQFRSLNIVGAEFTKVNKRETIYLAQTLYFYWCPVIVRHWIFTSRDKEKKIS